MNGSLLPWKVTVHFQNFPGDKLIKSQAVDSCQDYFMSMIKEASGAELILCICVCSRALGRKPKHIPAAVKVRY